MNATLLHQKHQKRFRDLDQGRYTPIALDPEERTKEALKVRERLEKIQNMLEETQVLIFTTNLLRILIFHNFQAAIGDPLKKPLGHLQSFLQNTASQIQLSG